MAVVHDLAEAIVGDITPHDGISKEEKHRREKEAIEKMCCKTLNSSIGPLIFVDSFICFQNRTLQSLSSQQVKKSLTCGVSMRLLKHQKQN
jgi:5'-deoxynucleotidase YfbR-like HD superfamily hydrolase